MNKKQSLMADLPDNVKQKFETFLEKHEPWLVEDYSFGYLASVWYMR